MTRHIFRVFAAVGVRVLKQVVILVDLAAVEVLAGDKPEHVLGGLVGGADHADLKAIGLRAGFLQCDDKVYLLAADVIMVEVTYRYVAHPGDGHGSIAHTGVAFQEIIRRVAAC